MIRSKPGTELNITPEDIALIESARPTVKTANDKRPYYNEEMGDEVRSLLDRLHDAKLPLRILADEYSSTTLKLRYYGGAAYLSDHNPSYAEKVKNTICRKYDDWIELHIKRRRSFATVQAVGDQSWRHQFERFLEEANPGDKLPLTGLALSEDDIIWFHNQLLPLQTLFVGRATPTEILVIRYEDTGSTGDSNGRDQGSTTEGA